MKIAVNTRLLQKNKLEGIGWFTFETLNRICNRHKEHEFIFIFDRDYSDDFLFAPNITAVKALPPTVHPLLLIIWFEYVIPKILKKHKADIFLTPDGFSSLSTDIPQLAVIHDINFVHRPKDLPFWVRKYYNYFFPKFAKKVNRIATVSKYSAMDIAKTFGIEQDKIDVTYNGVNEKYRPLTKKEKEEIRQEMTGGEEYFIFVGSIHPRKNINNLLKAFDIFRKTNSRKTKLLIVGSKMFSNKDIELTHNSMLFRKDVIFTGRLNIDKLCKVMGAAGALTFVPYFEGFGIPLLEAMSCDVPIITSNVTSMPEIASEAALYIDPNSPEQIAKAMSEIMSDDKLRQKLIEAGRKQRSLFSWQETADKLWQSIEKILGEIKK